MIDRRTLLTSAAGAAIALAPAVALALTPSEQLDEKLDKVLQKSFDQTVDRSPEQATRLGLDTGRRAKLRYQLDDRSPAAMGKWRELMSNQQDDLTQISRDQLSTRGAVNYDVEAYRLESAAAVLNHFHYGEARGRAAPYVVSQQGGAYFDVPNLLTNAHRIESREDADAYLARLKAFAGALDQDTDCIRRDAAQGVTPPDFILDQTLVGLQRLRAQAAGSSVLVRSVADRALAKGLGDYEAPAAQLLATVVNPALDRQIAELTSLRAGASHDAGVWRLPDGGAYYQAALDQAITATFTPDRVHELGLEQVKALLAELDPVLKTYGLTQGTVGERLAALNKDPANLYANTDEAKAQLVHDLNGLITGISAKLPLAFADLPKAALEIRRVPNYIEGGAPLGYYEAAPLDNSRPGIYYINLKNTADWPRFQLPTLTYHEGVPGHHFQISLAREVGDLPVYRRTAHFAAYTEGWALYAEQLADELGVYEKDPLGRIGYGQSLLFRAVRLVVDTGIHAKRWSREQAIRYMVDNTGRAATAAASEVDRYCAWPGQACSYKMGHSVLLQIRQNAVQKLGRKFDLKGFHTAVLQEGAVPLSTLAGLADSWVNRKISYG